MKNALTLFVFYRSGLLPVRIASEARQSNFLYAAITNNWIILIKIGKIYKIVYRLLRYARNDRMLYQTFMNHLLEGLCLLHKERGG